MTPPLFVLDTSVVISALIGEERSSNNRVLRAVETGDLRVATSDAFFTEISYVTRYSEVESRIKSPSRSLRMGISLGLMGEFHRPRSLDWPRLGDKKDWWIFDLAFESGADYIVTRDDHLRVAYVLGFDVLTPPQALNQVARR